jgi:hypothetical protein
MRPVGPRPRAASSWKLRLFAAGHSVKPCRARRYRTVTPHINRFPASTLRYQDTEIKYLKKIYILGTSNVSEGVPANRVAWVPRY